MKTNKNPKKNIIHSIFLTKCVIVVTKEERKKEKKNREKKKDLVVCGLK